MKSLIMNQSQLTEHLEQFDFDLINLVGFRQPMVLFIGVFPHVTLPFDVNEFLFESPMQHKTHRGRRVEEPRDKSFRRMKVDKSKPTDSICRAWMNVL